MLTPSFENTNPQISDMRSEEKSAKKPLDLAAFGLIALSIIFVCAGLYMRGVANQQALNQKIQAMINIDDHLWIGMPDELVQISLKENNKMSHIPYDQMQLPSPITYAVKTDNNYWVQLFSGQVWKCDLYNLPCHQVKALADGENHYYNIAVLPKANQIVAVNNFTSQITTLDADSMQVLATDIAYQLPPLDLNSSEQLVLNQVGAIDGWKEGKLYRSNRLHVIDNMLVQTDTGNQRIVAWPLDNDGLPEWKMPKTILKHTSNQGYDVSYLAQENHLNDQWLVLEGGAVLGQGQLVSYATNSTTATNTDIEVNTPDPTLLTKYDDHSFLVADTTMGKIIQVKYSPYSNASPSVLNFEVAGLDDLLTQLQQKSHFYKLLANLALLLCLAPFLALLILFLLGYDLNQKVGKA